MSPTATPRPRATAARLLLGASTAEQPQPPAASGFQPTLAGLSLFATPASGTATPPLELLEPPELVLPPLELEPPELLLVEPPLLEPLLEPELLPLLDPLLEPLLEPELLPLLEPLLELLEPLLVTSRSAPLGEPQPVGPSYPTPALQK